MIDFRTAEWKKFSKEWPKSMGPSENIVICHFDPRFGDLDEDFQICSLVTYEEFMEEDDNPDLKNIIGVDFAGYNYFPDSVPEDPNGPGDDLSEYVWDYVIIGNNYMSE